VRGPLGAPMITIFFVLLAQIRPALIDVLPAAP
jgi:hypothetical protein